MPAGGPQVHRFANALTPSLGRWKPELAPGPPTFLAASLVVFFLVVVVELNFHRSRSSGQDCEQRGRIKLHAKDALLAIGRELDQTS